MTQSDYPRTSYITRGRNRNSFAVLLAALYIRETERAVLCNYSGFDIWIPRTEIRISADKHTIEVRDRYFTRLREATMRKSSQASEDRDPDWREVHGEFIGDDEGIPRITNKAILWAPDSGKDNDQECWIPRSQIKDGDEIEHDPERTMIEVKGWFCDKEGIS